MTEKHWGDPHRAQPREDTTRRERVAGIAWLSVGALCGLFICVIYIGTQVTIGGVHYPLPWPLLFAPLFNNAISRTAKLWTHNLLIAAIPLAVWLVAVLCIALWPAFGVDQLMPSNVWSLLMMFCGFVGGAWPLQPNFSIGVRR